MPFYKNFVKLRDVDREAHGTLGTEFPARILVMLGHLVCIFLLGTPKQKCVKVHFYWKSNLNLAPRRRGVGVRAAIVFF